MIDRTSASFGSLPHRSRNTNRSICGFTDRMTMSAFLAAFRLSLVVATPKRLSRSLVRSACGSLAVIAFASTACELSRPPIIAPAIEPPPIKAIVLPLSAFAARFSAMLATFSMMYLPLRPDLPGPFDNPFIRRQLTQTHRAARVELLGRNAHLGSEPEL